MGIIVLSALFTILALVAVGAAIWVALYAAGFFQYLGGKKISPSAVDKETLLNRLLALNDPSKPYRIIQGDDTDLVAEWNIVDANWYGIFSKNRLSKTYHARLLLDESRHSVRCFEELGSVEWTAGTSGLVPSLHFQKTFFRGRILAQKEWAVGYGIKDVAPLEVGKVYQYKFDINDIRGPIEAAVKENGWEWVPVTVKKYAVYQQPLTTNRQTTLCPHCGGEIRADAVFCPKCGQKVG